MSKQSTGGSANRGPGNGPGVKPRNDRVAMPSKGYKVIPNSANRGKQG
jgi:hypothetical protein